MPAGRRTTTNPATGSDVMVAKDRNECGKEVRVSRNTMVGTMYPSIACRASPSAFGRIIPHRSTTPIPLQHHAQPTHAQRLTHPVGRNLHHLLIRTVAKRSWDVNTPLYLDDCLPC